jgi:signal transduction histidine kinase
MAARIREAREPLTHRWLERISARVNLDPNAVFPTDELLDHVPLLIEGIAAYLEDPASEVAADAPVIAKAMELGALRHAQGFDEYQILKEFELLGGIIFAHLIREVRTMDEPCGKDELLACGHRLFRAVFVIQQATVAHFLQQMRARLRERDERLRGFNRALTHELKNQIGAILGAGDLLEMSELPAADQAQLAGVVRRNAAAMRTTLENLIEMSQLDPDARQQRRVLLPQAVAESVRQLRDMAQAAGVTIRIDELPPIEVPAAAVELSMTNYLSNAIKYMDPAKGAPWAEIRGYVIEAGEAAGREVVVEVCDNGLGVPDDQRARLFARGFRAHAESVTRIEGTGLGLSIARDAIEAVGGRVWASFPPGGGSCFALALPARRSEEFITPEGRAGGAGARGARTGAGQS